ncbi:MAG: hypothetical protein IPP79_23930 [Chitinophagaceae bacterium]|nr:hypothetical protein [Chitinophagaceae bacterium]
MNNSLRLFLLISLSTFGFAGFAQQSSDTMKLKEMEKVVVTAFRDKVKTKYVAALYIHSIIQELSIPVQEQFLKPYSRSMVCLCKRPIMVVARHS